MMIELMQGVNSLGAARPIVLVGVAGLAVAIGGGCRRPAPVPAPICAQPPVTDKGPTKSVAKDSDPAEPPPRALRRCFPEQPAWVDAPVADLLDKAAVLFDKGDYAGTLACAEEAARAAPRSVEAHHNRAIALMRLDRLDEARDALELALALGPDDPETLEAAADLEINQLPPSGDRSALGLEYARRGSRHVAHRDAEEVARLALLEGQALIDLGRAAEALRRIDAALAAQPRFGAAVYERGVALFELCRFDEARATFTRGAGRGRGGRRAPSGGRDRGRPQVVSPGTPDHAARLRGPGAARGGRAAGRFSPRSVQCRRAGRRPPGSGGPDGGEAAALPHDPGPLPRVAARL
jgi:hypothetical protein